MGHLRLLCLAGLVATAATGCAEATQTGSAGPVGFLQLHEEYLAQTCTASACHDGATGIAGLSLSDPEIAYERLLNGAPNHGPAAADNLKLVVPGDPESSFLLRKLRDSGSELEAAGWGARMPLSAPAASAELLSAITDWIEAGAPYDGAPLGLTSTESDAGDERYVACDATDAAGMEACFPSNPGPGTYQRLHTPPLTIPGGGEKVMCSFLGAAEDDIRLRGASGQQMTGGHHIAVFVGLIPSPGPDPVDCDSISMGALRFVTGAGGAGGQDTRLPEGLGLTIKKGQQIVIQSHYINIRPEAVVVMDAIDLELTTVEESPTDVDPFAVMDSTFEVPIGAEGFQRVKECLIDEPIDLHMMLGHTHDYGVLFTLDLIRDEVPEQFYYATDGALLRDTPDILFFEEAVSLLPGDRIRITCEWDNTTDHPLTWPEEMCVALMYYSPGGGFLMCDTDDVSPQAQDGESIVEGCVPPGHPGNDKGVGKYCTVDGGECADTPTDTLCLAEFDDRANYCSVILCLEDEQCGAGASCVSEGPGSACVPAMCQ